MENRERVAWAVAGVLGLIILGAAIAFGVHKLNESGTSDPKVSATSEPKVPQNGFEGTAAELIKATADSDVDGYLALVYPAHRPTPQQLSDSFKNGSIDVAGCDTSGAKFRTAETNGGVSLDVIFARPCGEFGATFSCSIFFERQDADWWVEGFGCNVGSAATPISP